MIELTKKPEPTQALIEPPTFWHVMLLDDDVTSFEFVVDLLMKLFNHSRDVALQIAQEVHDKGKASAIVLHKELAETRACQVVAIAKEYGYTLNALIERVI